MKPYFEDGQVTLYLGDCRDLIPALGLTADLVVADPPYGETSLAWDRWPDGWPALAATVASSMWCFGSMRMFLEQRAQFAEWKFSQDVIWEKRNGTGFQADRFKRVHEIATHWYRGSWNGIHHSPPREPWHGPSNARKIKSRRPPSHMGNTGVSGYDSPDRLMQSIIRAANMHGRSLHPTEKPVGILTPLIEYACPPGGLVLDPFAGSGSTLDAARQAGRRAIGIEAHEPYAEKAARRLEQLTLEVS